MTTRARRKGAPGALRSLALLCALALLAAACTPASLGRRRFIPPTSRADPTTTTIAPTTVRIPTAPASYHVGRTVFTWVDTTRQTVNGPDPAAPIPGRVLETEVLYPTTAGAAGRETAGAVPASAGAPFPVIAFAHGFDVSPPYYAPLLDAWVKAGFIVVAPYFPDQKTSTVSEVGGPQSAVGNIDELDMANEPGDIAFVLQHFYQAVAAGLGPLVPGMARGSTVGLAGQSDGGDVVGGLVFGTAFAAARDAMPARVAAVAILSGASLSFGPTYDPEASLPPESEYATSSSPPVLQIQSRSDTCNWPGAAAQLFNQLSADPVHLFQTLTHASHLEPYARFDPGNPYLPIVEAVTTEFFELELGWRASRLSLATLERTANVPGYSSISATAPSFPPPPAKDDCSLPAPLAKKVEHNTSGG